MAADPFAGLPPGVAPKLRKYRPRLASASHGPFIARLVAAVRPGSKVDAGSLLGAVSGLVLWAQETGLDIDPAVLLDGDVIARYVQVGLDGYANTTRRLVRRNLDRVASAHAAPPSRRGRPARDEEPSEVPYTAAEIDGLLSWAASQRTERRRRSLLVMIAVGLGCGPRNAELRGITGEDVTVRDDGTVTVRVGGPHAREVVVRRRFEALLGELGPRAGWRWVVDPTVVPRDQQATAEIVHGSRPSAGVPALSPGRCRATWLDDLLVSGVRLDVIVGAAGLVDAQDLLARRLAHLEPEPPTRARAALRAAAHASLRTGTPGIASVPTDSVLRTGPVSFAAGPAGTAGLSPEILFVLDRYRPRLADRRHAPLIRRIAIAAGPIEPRIAGFMAGAAAALVGWADRHDLPTDLDAILSRELLDRWRTAPAGAGRWKGNIRNERLRWIENAVAVLRPDQGLGGDNDRGPYTRDEIDRLGAWAAGQPDPTVRGPLVALLAVGLGTGLRPAELALATGHDVTVDPATGGVLVTTRSGTPGALAVRTVPVLHEHETAALAAARRAGPGWLLDPTVTPGPRAVQHITGSAPRTAGVPVLTALRCRLTWLVAHLASNTRPDTLLDAAGLDTTANVDQYVKLVDPLPESQVRGALRGD